MFSTPLHSNTLNPKYNGQSNCNIDENRFENELREVTCSNRNSEQLIEVIDEENIYVYQNQYK